MRNALLSYFLSFPFHIFTSNFVKDSTKVINLQLKKTCEKSTTNWFVMKFKSMKIDHLPTDSLINLLLRPSYRQNRPSWTLFFIFRDRLRPTLLLKDGDWLAAVVWWGLPLGRAWVLFVTVCYSMLQCVTVCYSVVRSTSRLAALGFSC